MGDNGGDEIEPRKTRSPASAKPDSLPPSGQPSGDDRVASSTAMVRMAITVCQGRAFH